MRGLVLLYRNGENVTIREYSTIKEKNNYYIVGENCIGEIGIIKKYVGKVCKHTWYADTCEGHNLFHYPIDIPYMEGQGYFIFVNKNKYDENPVLYYDMIKNYREE